MGYRGSEADKKQRSSYMRTHTKHYCFDLYDTKEQDLKMREYLETKRPVSSYLKSLVEKDMQSKD